MKKILFATEFSDHAPEILKYAAELAYFFKADLLAMHAFGRPEPRFATEKSKLERMNKTMEKLIDFVTKHLPDAYREEVKVDYFAVDAYPVDAILELALEQEVDIIVMGMTGKTNAIGSILGNVTLNVLAKADCQVLMIPEKAKFAGIDNIVYTTNFDFRDLEALHYLKQWSIKFDAPIHALHIIEYDENELTILKNMSILKETFQKAKKIEFDLGYGDFRMEIEKFAKSKQADVVAMISHKRNFLTRIVDGSEVEEVAKKINIPLLVIKDDAYQLDERAWNWLELVKGIA